MTQSRRIAGFEGRSSFSIEAALPFGEFGHFPGTRLCAGLLTSRRFDAGRRKKRNWKFFRPGNRNGAGRCHKTSRDVFLKGHDRVGQVGHYDCHPAPDFEHAHTQTQQPLQLVRVEGFDYVGGSSGNHEALYLVPAEDSYLSGINCSKKFSRQIQELIDVSIPGEFA